MLVFCAAGDPESEEEVRVIVASHWADEDGAGEGFDAKDMALPGWEILLDM